MTRLLSILLALCLLTGLCPAVWAEAVLEPGTPITVKEDATQTPAPEETPEAQETPAPQKTPKPGKTPKPTPTPAIPGRLFVAPGSAGSVLYTATASDITIPAADFITSVVLSHYNLSDGYYGNIKNYIAGSIAEVMGGGALPSALADYRDAIEAAVSDINDGIRLHAQKKAVNSKLRKRGSAFNKGLPQVASYTAAEEESGYYFTLTGVASPSKTAKGTYYIACDVENAKNLKALTGADSMTFLMPVKIRKKSSGSSGGGGGGGSSAKPVETARLIIENVRTEPENPSAGDIFDVVLDLRNTSEKLYLTNLQMTYTSENDALEPVAGTNTVYIDSIDADSIYTQRLTVKAKPDIEQSSVKLEVAVEFEDKKLNQLSATQSVALNIKQVQRIQLDEPTLPTTDPMVGDTYEVKMGVFNLGKTILYNVTAKVVPENAENLNPGQSYFIGNMDPGTSKTVEMELIPLAAGDHKANLEVTYETVDGQPATTAKPISFNATEEEVYDYNFEDDYNAGLTEVPEVETPTAMSVLSALPWWLYAAAAGILFLIILCIGVSARKRRLRAMEDDEMD